MELTIYTFQEMSCGIEQGNSWYTTDALPMIFLEENGWLYSGKSICTESCSFFHRHSIITIILLHVLTPISLVVCEQNSSIYIF